jgi:hypothetical protein
MLDSNVGNAVTGVAVGVTVGRRDGSLVGRLVGLDVSLTANEGFGESVGEGGGVSSGINEVGLGVCLEGEIVLAIVPRMGEAVGASLSPVGSGVVTSDGDGDGNIVSVGTADGFVVIRIDGAGDGTAVSVGRADGIPVVGTEDAIFDGDGDGNIVSVGNVVGSGETTGGIGGSTGPSLYAGANGALVEGNPCALTGTTIVDATAPSTIASRHGAFNHLISYFPGRSRKCAA